MLFAESAKARLPPPRLRPKNWKDVSSLPLSLPAFPLRFAQRLRSSPRPSIWEGTGGNRAGGKASCSGENNERLLERERSFSFSLEKKGKKERRAETESILQRPPPREKCLENSQLTPSKAVTTSSWATSGETSSLICRVGGERFRGGENCQKKTSPDIFSFSSSHSLVFSLSLVSLPIVLRFSIWKLPRSEPAAALARQRGSDEGGNERASREGPCLKSKRRKRVFCLLA